MLKKESAESTLRLSNGEEIKVYGIGALAESGIGEVERLPYTIRILLENCLRHWDGVLCRDEHVEALASYDARRVEKMEIPLTPGRVLLQDLTGVPALVDLAALRDAMVALGGDVSRVNPLQKVDLVVDHSVQVDVFGSKEAAGLNQAREFSRNEERYQFLKWGEGAFDHFTLIPPGVGIVHQVNLEHLASVVCVEERDGTKVAFPDSMVGADSHTTMINGLGVLGWGVGGIEAEACMLGQPLSLLLPEVVGVRCEGALREGVTATDLVLWVTELLRSHDVVGKFVEFYGPGLSGLSLADRATLANMAPEYGATMGFFPVDERTLEYLRLTGRSEAQVELIELYAKLQGLWHVEGHENTYTSTIGLDLGAVRASVAGPTRPQDRVLLEDLKGRWASFFHTVGEGRGPLEKEVLLDGGLETLKDGAVALAAITSCTNTSNPGVMIAAGLVARKARALGLRSRPWVKTTLAPGSRVVIDYLREAGLLEDLEVLGFYHVGFGCTTCIGNTGQLASELLSAVEEDGMVFASVLSGNRNFEGRISPHTRANFLASPPLVVAYALAGTVDIDLTTEPLGRLDDGRPVFLRDLWPSNEEVAQVQAISVQREQFLTRYHSTCKAPAAWEQIEVGEGEVYGWSEDSTYIQKPPFFDGMSREVAPIASIQGARCLVKVGDSTTTDHISPAGAIPLRSPAADYLRSKGVAPKDFNTYGARRGNDQVMVRGTFGNVRLRNHLAAGKVGGYTTYFGARADAGVGPDAHRLSTGEVCSIYDAAIAYREEGSPLVVLAGKQYGMGSSRDWAAKGTHLLGVRAVIASSYERIHRSNLIGMGVLPLQFLDGEDCDSLGLTGEEVFDIEVDDGLSAGQKVRVSASRKDGQRVHFEVLCRVDSPVEIETLRNGGILQMVLRRLLSKA